MGKKFTYDLEPHEVTGFADRMSKVGMKNVQTKGNHVSFYDPRPIFKKGKKK